MAITAPVSPTVAPQAKLPFVEFTDKDGRVVQATLTHVGKQFLTQIYNQTVGANRVIPANCSNAGNLYSLTLLGVAPNYTGYATGDTFAFVASATSSAAVTGNVITPTGALKTVKVFKTNGSAQAGLNDITVNLHYLWTFVDSLDNGNGGFVMR